MTEIPPSKPYVPAIVELDVERSAQASSYLFNSVVRKLAWSNVTVMVPDKRTKEPKDILSGVSGCVVAGRNGVYIYF
jgi:hypothetical protein